MAEIVKRSNHLRVDIRKAYFKIVLSISIIYLLVLLGDLTRFFSFLPIGVFVIMIMQALNHIEILKFGLQGEKEAFDLLAKLPYQYKVLSDVHIVDGTKSSQIDFVIIGSNGLFIMESKHIKGTLNGREEDNYLQKVKYGKSGDRYVKRMYNPIKQILGHKIGMDIFLKKKGFRCSALPILYFSNDCTVNVQSKNVRIFNDAVLVIDYIKRFSDDNIHLSSSMQDQIANELKSLE